jgi:Flp pilus assembly protein TadG
MNIETNAKSGKARFSGLIRRLRGDAAGTTMAMMAAAMIPILGLVGSGLDMSRAYLVRAKMQQACDAGAIAGRRAMTAGVLTTANKTEAYRFFWNNFPNQMYGSASMVDNNDAAENRVRARLVDTQLGMDATTTVPTTVMRIFGQDNIRVNVECTGEEFIVNTDIMLVMDTTGSMNCAITDPGCSPGSTEAAGSKMAAMRSAVKTLYNDLKPTQRLATSKGLRMRFGMVPYSVTVNVGKLLRTQNAGYVRTNYRYYKSPSPYTLGSSVDATGTGWLGCIEEPRADTVVTSSITATSTSLPTNEPDVNMAWIPDGTDASKWAAYSPTDETADSGGNCPREATRLRTWNPDTNDFANAVDLIVNGGGNTHHDAGVIWGTRMLANTGPFGADQPNVWGSTGAPARVNKVMVFMTDGYINVQNSTYSNYGTNRAVARNAPKGSSSTVLNAIHTRRFSLMCQQAQSMGIDVWVIAILPTTEPITDELRDCASSPDQAFSVGDVANLTAAFKAVAEKVGNLRLGA